MINFEEIKDNSKFDKIAFFDFDNTLIKVNSLFYFLIYYRKRPLILELLLFTGFTLVNSIAILYALRSKDWRRNLKTVLWKYASFENESKMKSEMIEFFHNELTFIIAPEMVDAVKVYATQFDLCIVSASPDCIVEAFSIAFDNIHGVKFFYQGSDAAWESFSKSIYFSTNMRCLKKRVLAEKILFSSHYKYSLSFGDSSSDLHILSVCNGGYVGYDVSDRIINISKKL